MTRRWHGRRTVHLAASKSPQTSTASDIT